MLSVIYAECHYAKCRGTISIALKRHSIQYQSYNECCNIIVMVSVVILSAFMLNVVAPIFSLHD
jgi:hypothetical protein